MERIRNILVATDHSEHGRRAETRGAMLNIELPAEYLEMMTVQNTRTGLRPPATAQWRGHAGEDGVAVLAGNEARTEAAHRREGAGIVRSVRTGKTASAVIARANGINADLTIVSARAGNFFADIFARNCNDELVRQTERPLLLVNSDPKAAYRRVLVGVDFSAASEEAARVALRIAPAAQLTFIHAVLAQDEGVMREFGLPGDVIQSVRQRVCESGRGKLNDFIAGLNRGNRFISRVVEHGHPASTIIACARRLEADLVVVGKHGRSRIAELLLGSVAQRLMDECRSDLLIAPPAGNDDWHDRPAA